jgi:hypothetical protein
MRRTRQHQRAGWVEPERYPYIPGDSDRFREGLNPSNELPDGLLLPDRQITCAIYRPPCQSPFAKIFLFFRNPNQPYMFAILSHQEGRVAIVTFAGRAAVDAGSA